MNLVQEFTFTAMLKPPLPIGAGPIGTRMYYDVMGLLEVNEAVQGALASGAGTDFGEQYFFTNPRIETGDEPYAWVNTTFFIGEGHILPGLGVEYRV